MLTPSPELDRRIAEACGKKYSVGGWSPSTCLDHAWEAAESVGLFDGYMLGKEHDGYFLYGICEKLPDGSRVEGALVTESTPALAICAAIEEVCKVQA